MFNGQKIVCSRDIIYLICHVTSCGTAFKMLFDFKVTLHLVKFNGHKPCSSRDKMYLICHRTLKVHMIKKSFDFVERSSSFYITTKPYLIGIVTVVVEI